MCVITIVYDKKEFQKNFEDMSTTNPDGIGFAYADGERVVVAKFMDKKEALNYSKKLPTPFIAHFRLATQGSVCCRLAHPFEIAENPSNEERFETKSAVLFHNGNVDVSSLFITLCMLEGKQVPRDVSDTYMLAVLARKLGLGVLELVKGGKFAVLFPSGRIELIGEFQKKETNLYSNTAFSFPKRWEMLKNWGEVV